MCFGDEYQVDNLDASIETVIASRLQEITDRKHNEFKNPKISSSFSIPWITVSYEPGDIIYGIKGREIFFQALVAEVRFEFEENQRTEITLEDIRMEFS